MKYANWIKFAHDTPDKPEIWEIAAILKIDPDAVIGKLIRTWIWFDQHTLDGNAKNVTDVTSFHFMDGRFWFLGTGLWFVTSAPRGDLSKSPQRGRHGNQ